MHLKTISQTFLVPPATSTGEHIFVPHITIVSPTTPLMTMLPVGTSTPTAAGAASNGNIIPAPAAGITRTAFPTGASSKSLRVWQDFPATRLTPTGRTKFMTGLLASDLSAGISTSLTAQTTISIARASTTRNGRTISPSTYTAQRTCIITPVARPTGSVE